MLAPIRIDPAIEEFYMKAANHALAGALIGMGGTITNAMDANPGFMPCGRTAGVIIDNLSLLDTDIPADELAARTEEVLGFIDHVSAHRGVNPVPAHDAALTAAQIELLDALTELAAAVLPAAQAGTFSDKVDEYLYRSLAAIARGEEDVAAQLDKLDKIKATAASL